MGNYILKMVIFNGTFKREKFDKLGTSYYYDKNGTIYFNRLWENGEKSYVIIYYENEYIKFNGTFKNDNYNKGILYYENGYIYYKGGFNQDEELYGYGTTYYENGNIKYHGFFNRGKYDGNGTLYYYDKNGTIYFDGIWFNGKKNSGIIYYENWYIYYKGGFNQDEELHGYGTIYYENGNVKYNGKFKDYEAYGFRLIYYEEPNGTIYYEGQFKDNKKDGNGILYNDDLSEWVEGSFKEDIIQKGIIYKKGKNGIDIVYDGDWKDGKPNGSFNFIKNKIINLIKNWKIIKILAKNGDWV